MAQRRDHVHEFLMWKKRGKEKVEESRFSTDIFCDIFQEDHLGTFFMPDFPDESGTCKNTIKVGFADGIVQCLPGYAVV